MLTPTPDLQPAELNDALALVGQGVSFAWDEIIKRLERTLPGLIDAKNLEFGYADGKGILVPKAYGVAPAVASDDYINTVTVRITVDKTPNGTRAFLNEGNVEIFSVEKHATSRLQVETATKRAELIFAALQPCIGGCVNAAGKTVYAALIPRTCDPLPTAGGWDKYGGALCRFDLIQDQSCNAWEAN